MKQALLATAPTFRNRRGRCISRCPRLCRNTPERLKEIAGDPASALQGADFHVTIYGLLSDEMNGGWPRNGASWGGRDDRWD